MLDSDDTRWGNDRDAARDPHRGGRGGAESPDSRRGDARDVFTQGLDLPRGREREYVRERNHVYELNGNETRALATVGAFRVVDADDLRRSLDCGDQERNRPDGPIRHLREVDLVETVPLDGRGREAVVLTRQGRDLLDATRARPALLQRQRALSGCTD